MFTNISAGIGDFPCFPTLLTSELAHTISKERMVPGLMFSFVCAPQLSITDLKVKWLLHFAFSYVQLCFQQSIQSL